MLAAGIVVLAVTTAGACSDRQEPGVPTAAGSTVTSSPSRPAVLPLDAIMPCELMTDTMRKQFAIDRPDAPSATDPNAPVCTFISSSAGGYVVAAVRDKGVQALGRPVTTTVSGFPAVEIRRPNIKVGHLSIDVADGQRLDIEVQRLSSEQPVDEIYRDTMRFAEAVLATLRQKLGR